MAEDKIDVLVSGIKDALTFERWLDEYIDKLKSIRSFPNGNPDGWDALVAKFYAVRRAMSPATRVLMAAYNTSHGRE